MKNYKILLLLPIFKNLKFCQNIIFNQENFIARSSETRSLSEALNSKIFYEKIINISIPKPSSFFSTTITDEIKLNFNLNLIDLIIVDCSLSPVQHRNLEKILNKKIIDRTQLIIEIFGLRAKTKEGILQVELANLSFQKTRLVKSWTHLERQRGGLSKVGGPGESQLELDKRIIDSKIKQIRSQLSNVMKTRELQRRRRKINSKLIFSLVGYTNSGKSSIFNNLTQSNVLVKDMVFATLDTKMSLVNFPEKKQIILTDTVGFISALPTELINAFNSSLEELFSADFLLLVHDLSNENIENQANLVIETLFQIGFSEQELNNKIIHVFNKYDLNSNTQDINIKYMDEVIETSAISKDGLDCLKKYILTLIEKDYFNINFSIPLNNSNIDSWIYKNCFVYDNNLCQIGFDINKIKAKISSVNLDVFKSKFPDIYFNYI
ncbi:GTPase HflX [Pseudomonadota bacterium]|nr:GTPase HflX [Alphaproteobacteria bacterium]MDC1357221.1 GTPase HflX [Pseudomonadota bacterium]